MPALLVRLADLVKLWGLLIWLVMEISQLLLKSHLLSYLSLGLSLFKFSRLRLPRLKLLLSL